MSASVVTRFPLAEPELTDEQIMLRDTIRLCATSLELEISKLPEGRYKALALTQLEAAVLWAERGLV